MVRVRAVVVGTVAVHCALCVLQVRSEPEDLAGASVTEGKFLVFELSLK